MTSVVKAIASMTKMPNAVYARRFLLLLLLGLTACSSQQTPQPQTELSGRTMGTTYSIKYQPAALEIDAERLQHHVDARLAEINTVMSTYDPSSELSRLNQLESDDWVEVSRVLMFVLHTAKRIHQLSGGAFDPSIGPLVNLWGFGPDVVTEFPTEAQVVEQLTQVGFERLKLDDEKGRISRPAGMYIDLSAIAKGYAVDQIADLLASAGLENYLVEIGGELRASGVNAKGQPWHIAIERPQSGVREVHGVLNVSGLGMATSGDYRNFFEKDGQRYSHTLDPRTGYPVQHDLVSVTVLADDCMTADALATAFMVMGQGEASKLAEKAGIAAWFIEEKNAELVDTLTPKMQSYRLN